MPIQVSAGHGFAVHETSEGIMLSRDSVSYIVSNAANYESVTPDWMRGIDYLVYSAEGKIYVSPGTFYDHGYLLGAYETPAQTIEGFAPGDNGYIYLEIPKIDSETTATVQKDSAGTTTIGGNDYYFSITADTQSTFVGPTYDSAAIGAYASSIPSDKDFFRKELAVFSISDDGSIFIEQKHIGSVHLPVAIQALPTQFVVAIA